MTPFTTLQATAAPFPEANVNTDLIIRAERSVATKREDLGLYAFESVRYLKLAQPMSESIENPAFVLNREPFRGAQILIGGENFGCGSSRETAVWAIAGAGIRCVIAPSFGEIFFGNCFQNGILPIRLGKALVHRVAEMMLANPALAATHVDLPAQRVSFADGTSAAFDCDPYRKQALLSGQDAIGLTLAMADKIDAFHVADRARRPWIYELNDAAAEPRIG